MAKNLLPERNFHPADSDISFYCYTPCKDGTVVCVYSRPVGANLDDSNAEVGPPREAVLANNIPAGVIVQEFVELDNTRYSRDMSDFEVMMVGNKACVYKEGWFVTRCITPDAGSTTTAVDVARPGVLGDKPAYFDANGYFTTLPGSVRVGTFHSERDANGYARVQIDIPRYSGR